ncbi:MAG: PhnD/SsuA/transferrin family substrate-binding protein [Magnetococcales bacterium]|nr:PhnD/SsuA/transferrin family substrate-binding protein [Magnetococcales bacterium]
MSVSPHKFGLIRRMALVFGALWAFTTPHPVHSGETLTLTFGVYQSDKATVMYRKFVPVLEYLQESMEGQLQRSVDIHLKIFKGYEEANDAIVAGSVDFVRFGPASYIKAKQRNDQLNLLAQEVRDGKNYFHGVVIVPAASQATSLKDLVGGRFAFGNPNSTIGRFLAQGELVQAGVQGRDLAAYDYLGRHDVVFKAVALGDYDAGAVKETTLHRYNKQGVVRVLHTFSNDTKPWIGRAGLDTTVTQAIGKALFQLKSPDILKELKVTGFQPVTDTVFNPLREKIALSAQFGS